MSTKDFDIELYEIVNGITFPIPKKAAKIGIKMSGGMDSATILYVLTYLRHHGIIDPQSKFIPITGVNWPRPYQAHFVNKVINYVNYKYNCYGCETCNGFIPDTREAPNTKNQVLEEAIETLVNSMLDSNEIDFYYMGESRFLPQDYIIGTQWENCVTKGNYFKSHILPYSVVLDPTDKRSPWHHEDSIERIWDSTQKRIAYKYSIRPWQNMHKDHIRQITDFYGVSEDLLDITRSCEFSGYDENKQMMDWETHCGECMWCVERLVTYGRT